MGCLLQTKWKALLLKYCQRYQSCQAFLLSINMLNESLDLNTVIASNIQAYAIHV